MIDIRAGLRVGSFPPQTRLSAGMSTIRSTRSSTSSSSETRRCVSSGRSKPIGRRAGAFAFVKRLGVPIPARQPSAVPAEPAPSQPNTAPGRVRWAICSIRVRRRRASPDGTSPQPRGDIWHHQSLRVGDGWGARIRTWEWRYQKPLPYHLATPQAGRGCLDGGAPRGKPLAAPTRACRTTASPGRRDRTHGSGRPMGVPAVRPGRGSRPASSSASAPAGRRGNG